MMDTGDLSEPVSKMDTSTPSELCYKIDTLYVSDMQFCDNAISCSELDSIWQTAE